MDVAVFSAKRYDRDFMDAANTSAGHRITYFDVPLERETAALAADYDAVCIFVNDKADADVLEALSRGKTRLIASGQAITVALPQGPHLPLKPV
jgi:D-lactate dehydrogenase